MLTNLLIIFVVTFVVRIMTVMFGGGGMVLIPLLIFMGLTPSQAIATNRFGAQAMQITLIKFHQHKQVKWKIAAYFIAPSLIGGIIGAMGVVYVDQELFRRLLGFIILISLPLFLLKKNIGLKEFKLTKFRLYMGMPIALLMGVLGGMFASTGIWFTYLYLFAGLTVLQSAGTRKITGTVIGVSTTIIFIFAGLVNWTVAIVMMVASGLGGWIGADIGIKLGNVWLKRFYAVIALLLAIKMIFF